MRILIASTERGDHSAYLAEILQAFGFCSAELLLPAEALRVADPLRDIIILSSGLASDGMAEFLTAGGGGVAIRPKEKLAALAGLVSLLEDAGPSRLRFIKPYCYADRGEPLWTVGPIQRYEAIPDEQVLAFLYQPGSAESQSVGIAETTVGAGVLISYAYDPMRCIARLRQGDPGRANFLPPGERTPRATYLHAAAPPVDTAWRPTADLHAQALCEVIRHLLERNAPAPQIWHIPAGAAAILLLSGDEDASPQERNDEQMRNVESHGGSMNLYVVPDGTSITPALIADYTGRGHAISVHPNLTNHADRPMREQLAQAEAQVNLFKEKFGQPVYTLRNHCYMWPGYLDLPEVWERMGVGMDLNTTATVYGQSPEFGPFVNINAAMPLKFVREDGSLIDVYQQPTHLNDDILCSTNSYSHKYSLAQFDLILQRFLEDAARFFHSPICANIHPWAYVEYSGSYARLLASRSRALGFPIWSIDKWFAFWKARSEWKFKCLGWDEGRLEIEASGPPCEDLTILFPLFHADRKIQAVSIAGVPGEWTRKRYLDREFALISLPANQRQIRISVVYGSADPTP
jgi:hypothetical protein